MQRIRLDFVNFSSTQDRVAQRLDILVSITHRNTRHRLKTILPYRSYDAINEIENIRIKIYFHFIERRIVCYFLCNFH